MKFLGNTGLAAHGVSIRAGHAVPVRIIARMAVLLMALVFLAAMPAPAHAISELLTGMTSSKAQTTETTGDEALKALIDGAQTDGSTVVVISPPSAASAEPDEAMSMNATGKMLLRARSEFRRKLMNSAAPFSQIMTALRNSSPDGSWNWLGIAVATALGGIALGLGIYRLITRYLAASYAETRNQKDPTRAEKLRMLLWRATLLFLSSVVMFSVAILVAVIFDTGHEPTRQTIFAIVSAYAVYRVLRYVIFFNVLVPDADAFRMFHLSGKRARRLYTDWYTVIAVTVTLFGIVRWLAAIGISHDLAVVMFTAVTGITAIIVGTLIIHHRDDLVEVLRGTEKSPAKRRFREALARFLLVPAILYLAVAWAVSSFRLTLDHEGGYLLVISPMIVFVGACFAYGIAIYVLEVIYERREIAHRKRRIFRLLEESRAARRNMTMQRAASGQSGPMTIVNSDSDDESGYGMGRMGEGEEMIVYQPNRPSKAEPDFQPYFKNFFEGGIGAIIIVVALGELARLWGIDVGREEGHPLAHFLDSALVIALGLLFLRSVNDFINAKIVEEGGTIGNETPKPGEGDSEGGVGQSRMATLLPIFRAVIVAVLVMIGITIVLSNLGVDVAPLFAGAGVVGIAIGFGAQTLIRDIFSGLFFLIDDAFRKGEYIQVGEVKGVIEKISIRSFQLRHHLGAVHTVPFGEIHQLTNYSRDWVMMKLPLRVTYGTDVEKVRKLIKKLGQELLSHPEIGKTFLQPLKSQGVYAMEDSAMIIRVKFMTKPGDQFVTRKVVYARIRELFEQEGIPFAHREVTVRLADGKAAKDLSPEEREAVAGSVRSVIDDENQRPALATGDR